MSTGAVAAAAASSVLLLGAVWVAGSCLVPRAAAAERLAAGILAALGLAWLAMFQPLVGVSLLGSRPAVWIVAGGGLAALAAWRRPRLLPARPPVAPLAVAAAAGALVAWPGWTRPVAQWPVSHLDTLFHAGWTHQLVGGMDAPGGVYAHVPNTYPWLYHALAAWIAQGLPGGVDAALLAVETFGVAALAAGVWLLAAELRASRAAAAWAIVFAVAGGGVGWIWQHSAAGVWALDPATIGAYHGDLVLSNALVPGLGDVPPLVPRELGVALTPLVLWLILRGVAAGSTRLLAVAGGAIGLAFLAGPLAGGFCALWLAAVAVRRREPRALVAAAVAAAVSAVWLGPLAATYHRDGGFVSITHKPPINPSLAQAVVALGVVLPLAAVGLARRSDGSDRRTQALLVAVPLAACLAGAAFGSGDVILGSPAITRWLRFLPYLALTLAVPAGAGAAWLVEACRRPATAAAAAAAVGSAAVASTALATVAVDGAPEDYWHCGAFPAGPGQTVAVVYRPQRVADDISLELFSDTGAPMLFVLRDDAKIRDRGFLTRPPSQHERRAQLLALRAGGTSPAGVRWLVEAPGEGLGGTPAATCASPAGRALIYHRSQSR